MAEQRPLPDLSNYIPTPGHREQTDLTSGEYVLHRTNPNTGQYFRVNVNLGFDRPHGPADSDFTHEPDVVEFDQVEATPGAGLGAAAVCMALSETRRLGIRLVRSHIINPAVVGINERLREAGIISETFYRIEAEDPNKFALAPTAQFHVPNDSYNPLCSPEQAKAYLSGPELFNAQGDPGFVDCVIWL